MMRPLLSCFRLLALVLVALTPLFAAPPPSAAVTIDWVAIGNPGNAADTASNCSSGASCGVVGYEYFISKYETTNAQYAEFLNAKAAADPYALWNANMGGNATFGGITRSGVSGSFTYAVKPGFANKPVAYTSFYDAARFANWLNNGQGSGDTETGAYTLLGGTINPSNGLTFTRNPGANAFLPSENEWYKAAYYSPGGTYFDYPTGTNSVTGCVAPGSDTGNSANCSTGVFTTIGAYSLSDSPYGTYDQGGNVFEWNEQIVGTTNRGLRGGNYFLGDSYLSALNPASNLTTHDNSDIGFRVAMIPEPGTALLVLLGLTGLAAKRRRVD
jgi:formylglycine-generating enzyme required for sulfatase activity